MVETHRPTAVSLLHHVCRVILSRTRPTLCESLYTLELFKTSAADVIGAVQVVLFCDMHGHSRKKDIFVYGCERGQAIAEPQVSSHTMSSQHDARE